MLRILLIISLFLQNSWASHHPQEFLADVKGKADEGAQIYKQFCVNCHAQNPLINLGAPKIGDENAWKTRLQQNFSDLFSHLDEGVGAMPSRGGCFECSNEQLWLATLFMLPKNEQNVLLKTLEAHKKSKY